MALSSQKYWERRALKDYIKIINQTEEYIHQELRDFYKLASEDISKDIEAFYIKYADKDKIPLREAKRKVKAADIKDAKLDEAAKAKRNITRLELIQYQIDARVSELYDDVQANIYDYLYKTYGAGYTSAIGITGAKNHLSFTLLSRKAVEAAILQNWSGKNFSERIWGHRANLSKELKQNIVSSLIKGEGVDKMSRRISKRLDVKFSDAKRLVRTESNYIFNKGTLDGYLESGIVAEYQYLATLDNRTSQICRSLDSKIFPAKEAEPGRNYPPMHPNCRSTTVAYFDEDLSKTVRRAKADGESYLVSADTNYSEWHNSLSDKQRSAMESRLKMSRNKGSDKKQHEKYKEVLGSNVPNSLTMFQRIKYNDSEAWGLLNAKYKGIGYYNKAIANEPEITAFIKKQAEKNGMKAEGLEYRIKSKESYLRKIESRYDPKGNKYEVKDIIRYTYTASPDTLSEKTINMLKALKEANYTTIEIKNTWYSKIDPYRGINTSVKAPSGQIFEIQYHTPESFKLKDGELHKLYEQRRIIKDKSSDEAKQLWAQMFELSSKLAIPKNIKDVK